MACGGVPVGPWGRYSRDGTPFLDVGSAAEQFVMSVG